MISASVTSSSRATLFAIALSVDAVSVGELEIALNTSEVALCCSNASSRSRLSSAIVVLSLVLEGLRRPLTLGALKRLGVAAFRRRVLIGLPPALERRRIASPKAQDKASYRPKLVQWEWPRVTSSTVCQVVAPRQEGTGLLSSRRAFTSGLIYC